MIIGWRNSPGGHEPAASAGFARLCRYTGGYPTGRIAGNRPSPGLLYAAAALGAFVLVVAIIGFVAYTQSGNADTGTADNPWILAGTASAIILPASLAVAFYALDRWLNALYQIGIDNLLSGVRALPATRP